MDEKKLRHGYAYARGSDPFMRNLQEEMFRCCALEIPKWRARYDDEGNLMALEPERPTNVLKALSDLRLKLMDVYMNGLSIAEPAAMPKGTIPPPGSKAYKKNLPNNSDLDVPHRAEPEFEEVVMVKCRKCACSVTWERFTHIMGSKPNFCRCKPGEENIVKTTEVLDVAKRVKPVGR